MTLLLHQSRLDLFHILHMHVVQGILQNISTVTALALFGNPFHC